MANKLLKTRMQQKIDTSQNWAKATNFVPLKGEICIYSDLHRMKVGDGTTKINDLDFFETVASSTTLGSIKADAKTENDTVPARIDTDGKLWVKVPDAPLIVTATAAENNTGTLDYSESEILAAVSAGREVYLRGSMGALELVFAFGGIFQGHPFFYNIFTAGLVPGAMLAMVEGNQVTVYNAGFVTSDDLDMFKYQIDPQLLPEVTASDNDKILKVVNGAWSATTAGAATSADKLNTDAGSATHPVYFKDGVPVETTYTLGKSVPSDAKFTDTVTEVDATLTAGGTNPVQGGAIKSYIDEKTAGLTGAMHFQGKATVDIADGSTTDPVISGYDFANKKAKGDVILGKDDHKEFVWDGSKWELLGDEGSYVLNTVKINNKPLSGNITLTASDVGAATASDITTEIGKLDANEVGGTGKYIQSIQQTDGKISATAGTMPTALKNPNALTFTGAVTGTYDGSAAKTVNIPTAITVDDTLSDTSSNPIQNKAVKAGLDAKISKSGGTFTGELTYLGTNESAINLGGDGSIRNVKSFQFSGPTDKINITQLSDTIGLKLLSNDNTDVIVSGIATPTSDNHAVNKQYVDNKVPNTTTSDNNKFLRVVNGVPTWVALINVAEEGA